MSTAYHASHPRVPYEPHVPYEQQQQARPGHVLPEPYDSRPQPQEPATIHYTAPQTLHAQQPSQQLPRMQPAMRPVVTIPEHHLLGGGPSSTVPAPYHTSHHAIRAASPLALTLSAMGRDTTRSAAESLTQSSPAVPYCINPRGGAMFDLVTDMTCLFWFESVDVIRAARNFSAQSPSAALPPLTPLAYPDPGFRKWVNGILKTTQVTQNVIVLALLFIYRLKMINPQVLGRPGSEYRLLTVALMLGNKFLDDNTYTNKTWAEVSHIQVAEIHVMEVEFLSNMRYNLFVSAEEWDRWLVQLASFVSYCRHAGERMTLLSPTAAGLPPLPSAHNVFSSPLSSPTRPVPPTSFAPNQVTCVNGYVSCHPSSHVLANSALPQTAPPHAQFQTVSSPLLAQRNPRAGPSRKRSLEEDVAEFPAKRVARSYVPSLTMSTIGNNHGRHDPIQPQQQQQQLPQPASFLPPPPNLSHPPALEPPGYHPTMSIPTAGPLAYSSQPSLPPLKHGVRAMSIVYPTASAAAAMAPAPYPASSAADDSNGYQTPTKPHSPPGLGMYASSPLAESFPLASTLHTSSTHTPVAYSPMVYLQDRSSPYKPIRHVNKLLHPPPSASLHGHHVSEVGPSQMHYQPLGRRHDLRTGIVPDFVLTPPPPSLRNVHYSDLYGRHHSSYSSR